MKTCPVCSARLFDDMDTCYGCMHRFEDEAPTKVETPANYSSVGGKLSEGKPSSRGACSADKLPVGDNSLEDKPLSGDNPPAGKSSIEGEASVNSCSVNDSTNNPSVFVDRGESCFIDVDEPEEFCDRGELQESHSSNIPLGIQITTLSGCVVSLAAGISNSGATHNGTQSDESTKTTIDFFNQPYRHQPKHQKNLMELTLDKSHLLEDEKHDQQVVPREGLSMHFEFADWDRSQDMSSTCMLTLNSVDTKLSMITALSKDDCSGEKTFDPVVRLEI